MFDTILVPLDGSAVAERVIPFAAKIARPMDGRIIYLRAVPPERDGGGARLRAERILDARRYLADVINLISPGDVNFDSLVVQGDPPGVLAQAVKEQQPDLVVMLSRNGDNGSEQPVLGRCC